MEADKLRIGLGHDTHRLGFGGPLLIGGVKIDFDRHLIGHSDADVLLHAITDALLGAANQGDIGTLFPNDSAENADRDSTEMLQLAFRRVRNAGYRVINLDCVVFAEQPKLADYREEMQKNISAVLEIDASCVGIKSKSGEKVGPIGKREAISAECVVLLCRE